MFIRCTNFYDLSHICWSHPCLFAYLPNIRPVWTFLLSCQDNKKEIPFTVVQSTWKPFSWLVTKLRFFFILSTVLHTHFSQMLPYFDVPSAQTCGPNWNNEPLPAHHIIINDHYSMRGLEHYLTIKRIILNITSGDKIRPC